LPLLINAPQGNWHRGIRETTVRRQLAWWHPFELTREPAVRKNLRLG
jgi:hypothetical protein